MEPEDKIRQPLPDSLWAATACSAPQTMPLQGDHISSVVIIGGGYTGLSAALHLAEKGIEVTVLEAEEIGFGGSGRNVGLVNAGLWLNPDDIEKRLGSTYASVIAASTAPSARNACKSVRVSQISEIPDSTTSITMACVTAEASARASTAST